MQTSFSFPGGGFTRCILAMTLVGALPGGLPAEDENPFLHTIHAAPAKLVQIVRDSTRQFANVNAATAAGYVPYLGCVSGPDHGAMGVHYVNFALVADNAIDATKPEALVYEVKNGGLQLVAVEYIADATAWLSTHSTPPVLEGQTFQFMNAPNRFALPSFFELHVWAWRDNPNGAFVDWNNNVSCEGQ